MLRRRIVPPLARMRSAASVRRTVIGENGDDTC